MEAPITLNVGGKRHMVSKKTLLEGGSTYFTAMFSGDHQQQPQADGSYFIDRSGKYFHVILDVMRGYTVSFLGKDDYFISMVIQDAQYYGLEVLAKYLTEHREEMREYRRGPAGPPGPPGPPGQLEQPNWYLPRRDHPGTYFPIHPVYPGGSEFQPRHPGYQQY